MTPRVLALDHAIAMTICTACAGRRAATARFAAGDGFLAAPATAGTGGERCTARIAQTIVWGDAAAFPLDAALAARIAGVLAGDDRPLCANCRDYAD